MQGCIWESRCRHIPRPLHSGTSVVISLTVSKHIQTYSLYLNAIEYIWDQMGLFIRDMDNPPTTVARLREALLQAWGAVTPERMDVLVPGVPRRLRAMMAASGVILFENRKTRSTTMFPENFSSFPTMVREIWFDCFRNAPLYSIKISNFAHAQASYISTLKYSIIVFQQSHILVFLVSVNHTKQ